MSVQPIRFAADRAFSDALMNTSAANAESQGRYAVAGIEKFYGKKEAEELAKAYSYRPSGGTNWGSLASGVLGLGKSLLGGGGGGGLSFGSSFTSSNFKMPDYMGGAGNFSSFWNG